MMKKLRQKKGETLLEALIAMLIAVLAMGLVSTASLAAASINEKVEAMDKAYSADLKAVETYGTGTQGKELVITFGSETGLSEEKINVEVYGDNGMFASYRQGGNVQ